jgi:curli production assembly/transport component CsgE
MNRLTHRLAQSTALLAALLLANYGQASSSEINGNGGTINGNSVRIVPEELYGGMVVNQTITVIGRDFYDYFVAAWREFPMTERYVISIHEWPSARWGSRIRVEYAQRPVFQAFLQPVRARIKEISEQAAEKTYSNTIDTEVQRLLFRDPDLGVDEM